MKRIIIAATAAAAALVVMSALSATSASAKSVICKTAEQPCLNESNWYGAGTPLAATVKAGTKVTFTNPIVKSECSSILGGELTGSGGPKEHNVPFTLNSASFTGCSNYANYTVVNLPLSGAIATLEPGKLGVMRIQHLEVKFTRLGVWCTMGGQVDALIKNNSELLIQPTSLLFREGSALCGDGGTISGSYSLTAPNPFHLASA